MFVYSVRAPGAKWGGPTNASSSSGVKTLAGRAAIEAPRAGLSV